ncbi:ATPase, partial [Rathayibacter sp. AY1H3]
MPPPRVDVVYYIRFGERIKIGTSGNPRQRLHRLR